jgi:uncharacterized protein (DUF1800 family)
MAMEPYEKAGLTEQQAAVHLLNRLTFGPRPGDVEHVVKIGINQWIEQQLSGQQPDAVVDTLLDNNPILTMSAPKMVNTYPDRGRIIAEARKEGYIAKENVDLNTSEMKKTIEDFMDLKGYHPQEELWDTLYQQKILRAVYSENQLTEVLTDFWFNHFNVSVNHPQARTYLLAYERDAIRPYALGAFSDMLSATAHHPAMLYYLDNAQNHVITRDGSTFGSNENYAREVMELHTLGVDGGYTQQDVVAAARVLTGWGVIPQGAEGDKILAGDEPKKPADVVIDNGFWFRGAQHDNKAKLVMGYTPTGTGLAEGDSLLQFLAANPATAKHIATEFTTKFVSDNPSPRLVESVAKAFRDSGGKSPAMLRVILRDPEFWAEAKKPTKVKSPFELVISSLRGTNADVTETKDLLGWIARMGQPLYACLPPTGYPDRGDYWLNSGTLLTRINFAVALAKDGLRGIKIDKAGKTVDEWTTYLGAAAFQYRQ